VTNKSGESYTLVGAQPSAKFTQWLDALLAGEAPPTAKQAKAKPAELPFWAKPEGLAPDPERPGYTLAGDQYKGNPQAALVIVEFADFQCPPCRRHALEVQSVLDQRFVDTGEVLWVFKHLPLKEHAQSAAAAAAAECAAEQNRFWEMHHLLFEHQERWAGDATDTALLALAAPLDLDQTRFTTCFNGRQALERVLADLYDAQGVVRTTPTFIMVYGDKGSVMRGSLPAEQFVTRLQARLAAAKELAVANTDD
jgi:protein-disulfide isomerase